MPNDSIHFYEPSKGHGLKHDPFNAIVGPRPIGWIASQGKRGNVNLAPYSFFNAFNYKPPIVGFASVGSRKDTLGNVEATGEFTWNLATRHIAENMNKTAAHVPSDVSEFEITKPYPRPKPSGQAAAGGGGSGIFRMQGDADRPAQDIVGP